MWNDGTGQYFDHARYYSPIQDRFTSQDPIGCTSSEANLYRYVADTPINSSDPLGMLCNDQASDTLTRLGLGGGLFAGLGGITAALTLEAVVSGLSLSTAVVATLGFVTLGFAVAAAAFAILAVGYYLANC
jgi:RHS repeat-associated protein